jgi:hypothetical protein
VLRRDQERTNLRFASALEESQPREQARARIRDLYAALIAGRRGFLVKLIKDLYRRAGAVSSMPLEALAMGPISLMKRVNLFGASCPEGTPPDVAQSILTKFVDSVLLAPEKTAI